MKRKHVAIRSIRFRRGPGLGQRLAGEKKRTDGVQLFIADKMTFAASQKEANLPCGRLLKIRLFPPLNGEERRGFLFAGN